MSSDTFIEVAEDCPAVHAEVPPARGDRPTKAAIEYELIAGEPYALTEQDVAFRTRVVMRDIPEADWPAERERFLSQEKPRLRVSALAKRYGWGIHIDAHGRVALVAVESADISASLPTQRYATSELSEPSAHNGAQPLCSTTAPQRGASIESLYNHSAMGGLKRITPIFAVRDLDVAMAHYERLAFATRAYHGGGYGFATRDGIEIHLGVVPMPDQRVNSAYLFVDDADVLAEEWRSAGVEVHSPQDTEWGQHEGAVVDPDGNVIRFGSPM